MADAGILLGQSGTSTQASFPKELKKGFLGRLDPRFTVLFFVLLVVAFTIVLSLSHIKPSEEYSEKAAMKIQERYAQLVMNEPKPKEVAPITTELPTQPKETSTTTSSQEGSESGQEVQVDRQKESYVQREERRAATSEMRQQVRANIAKQVQTTGIFAAITAAGGSGGSGGMSSSASDLLGTAGSDGMADIGNMSLSKGAFASRNVDPAELVKRKGERTTNVGIEKQTVGRATVTQVASAGTVNITTEAPTLSGESSGESERSQSAINRIVTRETSRLKRVFEDWLKRDPTLNGKLILKWIILPSGAVSNVTVVKSTTNNPEFDETIIRYVKRWQFQPISGDGSLEVTYPFVFEGQS